MKSSHLPIVIQRLCDSLYRYILQGMGELGQDGFIQADSPDHKEVSLNAQRHD